MIDATATPSGRSETLAGDALTQADGIAQQLHISQRLAATLLLQSADLRSQYPARSDIIIAIYAYMSWYDSMLIFLHDLLTCTMSNDISEALEPIQDWVLKTFTVEKTSTTLAEHCLKQIDVVGTRMQQVLNQQGIDHELLEYSVGMYRLQQDKLAGLLGLICKGGHMRQNQALRMLRWLKGQATVGGVQSMVAMAWCSAIRPFDEVEERDPRLPVRTSTP